MRFERTGLFGLGIVGTSLLLAACSGGGVRTAGTQTAAPAQARASARCARRSPGVGAARLDGSREGNAVALAKVGDRTIAYVADEDDGVVHTVDVTSGKELVTTELAGHPSQILVAKDGRVVATIRDKNVVQVLEPAASPDRPLENLCSLGVAAEPIGVAATPDDSTIVVTSAWGRALTGFDEDTMTARFQVPLAREPRAVVVSDDGSKAYVSHVVGSRMSAVDLRAPEHPVRTVDLTGTDPAIFRRSQRGNVAGLFKSAKGQDRIACQGFALAKSAEPAGRVFAPQVLVDPGDTEQTSGGYGDGFRPAEVASIAVVDEATSEPLETSLHLGANDQNFAAQQKECLLPRSAAADPERRSIFVTCLGIDSVVEYDAASADPRMAEKARWQVGAGPTGIAIDTAGNRAIVWSQFDQALSVISLGDDAKKSPAVLALSRKAKTAVEGDVALGRKLFHAAGDPRIAADGRACASCHPDGRDDSLTWSTPEGPRNTPMLAGRVSHPGNFGWNGVSDSVQTHLHFTFARLRGRGLEANELSALDAYLHTMRTPVAETPQVGPEAERIARGKAVFESSETACATCHRTDGTLTDGDTHDVSSSAHADREPKFETPTLRFVGGTAPYFHDGRYRTLRELLVGSDGTMGHTKQLSPDDLDALEAYMRSL